MKRLSYFVPVASFLAVALAAATAAGAAQQRIALVIGNSAYASGALPNPASDASLVRHTLEQLGFQVIERTNADQTTMKRAIQGSGRASTGPAPMRSASSTTPVTACSSTVATT